MKNFKTVIVLALTTVTLLCCNTKKNLNNATISVNVPTENQVGVKMLTAEIAPVKAPFATINFVKPVFPIEKVILALSSTEVNTTKIQKSIDELSAKGGNLLFRH